MDNQNGRFYLHIDQDLGTVYIRHRGKISLKDLNAAVIDMGSSPEFGSVTRGISDFTKAKGLLSSDDIRSHVTFVARHIPRGRKLKWAIIARTNLAYGLARMFDILSDTQNPAIELQVFKDPHEAKVWLGIKENRHVS
jgi:hypothetical protein